MTEIAVLTGGAPKEALNVLTPLFERQSGHTVRYTYVVISEIQKRLAAGETPDVAFMPVAALDALIAAGTVSPPRAVLGSVGIGVVVRAGAPHPDISTADKFRDALAAARAVVHANPAVTPSGAHLGKVLPQLGLGEALQAKLTYANALDGGVERIVKGDADIGIYPVSEIIAVKGISLVGLLPSPLQSLIVYGAGVLSKAAAPEAARALVAFLTDPAHRTVWKDAGFEPPQ